ncbi:MAG TPA: hypothetical protein QGF02_01370 [Candidatus Babeliales bacterium]|nr:hypothetical protein [Candidatus Babeliales bacterium]
MVNWVIPTGKPLRQRVIERSAGVANVDFVQEIRQLDLLEKDIVSQLRSVEQMKKATNDRYKIGQYSTRSDLVAPKDEETLWGEISARAEELRHFTNEIRRLNQLERDLRFQLKFIPVERSTLESQLRKQKGEFEGENLWNNVRANTKARTYSAVHII